MMSDTTKWSREHEPRLKRLKRDQYFPTNTNDHLFE
jgi:hypothetical protein